MLGRIAAARLGSRQPRVGCPGLRSRVGLRDGPPLGSSAFASRGCASLGKRSRIFAAPFKFSLPCTPLCCPFQVAARGFEPQPIPHMAEHASTRCRDGRDSSLSPARRRGAAPDQARDASCRRIVGPSFNIVGAPNTGPPSLCMSLSGQRRAFLRCGCRKTLRPCRTRSGTRRPRGSASCISPCRAIIST